MSDENNSNSDDLSGKSILPTPEILLPFDGAVRRGFTFSATTQRLVSHSKWNLDFFRASDHVKLKRYSGGEGVGDVTYQVPDELPTATGIYCKFQYAVLFVYSDWVTSHVFRIVKDTPDPLTAPTITNPGTVRTPRPTLSGRGAGSALVELYQAGVGTVVFASTRAHSLGEWSIELTESLWMADPFNMTARQMLNGETSDWAIPVSFTVLFKPVITSVSVSDDRKPTVSGTGGLKGATLEIFSTHSPGYPLFPKIILDVTGDWSVTATSAWLPGEYTITAKQSVRGEASDLAVDQTFVVKPSRPTITSVEPDVVHLVRGTGGHQGARLVISRPGGFPLSKTLGSDGIWWIADSTLWPPGKYDLTAIQYVGSLESGTSDVFTVVVKPPAPVINQPPDPSTAKQTLTITQVSSGTVKLQIFTEANASVAGNFTGTGTTRTFTPTAEWEVGSTKIKVVQTVNDVPSDPSALVTVVVKPPKPPKPPKPIIEPPPNPAAAKQPLTISAVLPSVAVILQMFTDYNSPVAGEFTGSGATRTFNPATDWAVGAHRVKVVQTVDGVASDPSDVVTFKVNPPKPPRPIIEPPPVPAEMRQALTITGVLPEVSILSVFTEADERVVGTSPPDGGTTRTFTPLSAWKEGPTRVKVLQLVGNVESDPSELVTVARSPNNPYITSPPYPAAANQTLTINGVFGSDAVTLQMYADSGAPIAGEFTGSGATRTFTPTENWTPGTTKVGATQKVAGAESRQSSLVTLMVEPPKPVIEPPPYPAVAKETLTVNCVFPGAISLQMLKDGAELVAGEFTGSGTTRIFTPKANWAQGRNQVAVKLTVDDLASSVSDVVTVAVKPSKPVIEPPPIPAAEKQVLTITDVFSSGAVTLQMFTEADAPVAGAFTGSGTTRAFTPTANWAFGTTTVKVIQTVDTVDSDPSEPITVSVKPSAPQITTPKEGETHLAVVLVKGSCMAGATVVLQDASGNPIAGTVSYSGTIWSFNYPWLPGAKHVRAVQTVNGQTSGASELLEFYIKPPQPTINPPPNPAAADEALTITGVFSSGAVTLKMFTRAEMPVPGEFTGSGTTRTFTPTGDWAPGNNTVKVVQTVNAVDSDPSDECTFSVEEGEKPDVPEFILPRAGTKTSTRPTIRVSGLAGALHTVRLEHGATLHADKADALGTLEFTVETPLVPGTNALQVKQKEAGGPASDWSEARQFTVKELPKIPTIDVPQQEALASRKPLIRGKGETRGEILLRHADEPKEPIATFTGVTSWRWTAKEAWPLGHYTIEAQQTDDGDSSEWSETRSFEVVDSLYAISDATPVIGNPVVGSGQSVKLRVQVVFGDTGEAAEGVKVEWRIKGKEDVLATTVTDSGGWAHYAYTPETDGKSEVVADITSDNDGVVMTELYEVNAQLQDAWAPRVTLYLDAWPVDLSRSDLVLVAGQTYRLRIALRENSHLWGSTITLEDVWGAAERGLTFVPALGTPQKVEANALSWAISSAQGQSGIFGLKLTSPVLPDWQLPGQVITSEMAQSVDVDLDTFPQVFGGEPACPCLGATHTITVRPKPDSPWLNHPVRLFLTYEAADLGVTVSPVSYQTMGANGVSWSLDCVNSSKSGNFVLWLESQLWGSRFSGMPMFLGHNKVEITEQDGPRQIAERWRYGVRVVSAFTMQPAGDVPVTVTVSGSEDVHRTQSDGWIYVHYDDGQVVSFTIHNGYDGSTVTG